MNGSLQIKNDKYYIVSSYKDIDGKYKTKWISTNLPVKGNKKAAQEMLNKWCLEHSQCNMAYANVMFADYLERWIKDASAHIQRSTLRGYKSNLKNHILPYFRNTGVKLVDLKIRDLERFYNYLSSEEKSLSPQSVRHCHRIISKSLNDAIRLEIISSNPATLARLPKLNRFVGTFLNMEQLQELVKLFRGKAVEPVVKFICTYGLRRSEALGLCWDKVDFNNNQFTVCRTMIQGDGENYIKDCTKNDSSYRTLPLTADMREMLLELKAKRSDNQKLFGASYVDNMLVFTFPDGSPISPNYLTRTFHNTVENSNLPKVRLHDLRHSVATNLLAKGMSLVDTQLWLGHSQPSTTLNFYAHADSSSKKNIQLLLDEELHFDNDEPGDSEQPVDNF